jgi:hypothetical protein
MRLARWVVVYAALGTFLLTNNFALAQGHGKGHNKHNDDQGEHFYKDHDREVIRDWYSRHSSSLPPGLAKRDELPPGLEKQLVQRGTLPPGLQKRLQPCPEELERRLPPPPPDCAHVVIGGHLVLLNRRTNVVVDIFHFETR